MHVSFGLKVGAAVFPMVVLQSASLRFAELAPRSSKGSCVDALLLREGGSVPIGSVAERVVIRAGTGVNLPRQVRMEAHPAREISDAPPVEMVVPPYDVPAKGAFPRCSNQELARFEEEVVRHPEAAVGRLRVRSASYSAAIRLVMTALHIAATTFPAPLRRPNNETQEEQANRFGSTPEVRSAPMPSGSSLSGRHSLL